jgi:hypothetical protein
MNRAESSETIYENQPYAQPAPIGQYLRNPGGSRHGSQPRKSGANSERAELVGRLTDRLNEARLRDNPARVKQGLKPFKPLSYGYLNKRLAAYARSGTALQPIYALESSCLDAERRGVPFSAAFWTELNRTPKQLALTL